MSFELLCCLPVLALWFAPLVFVGLCFGLGGCRAVARRLGASA